VGESAGLRGATAIQQRDLQQRPQHRGGQQRDQHGDRHRPQRPDDDSGAAGAARAGSRRAGDAAAGRRRGSRTAAFGRAEGGHAAKSVCTRRRQARHTVADAESGGAAREAPAGSARPAALAVTERHADNSAFAGTRRSCKTRDTAGAIAGAGSSAAREAVAGSAVGGACSNSKTGHTAIAWSCRCAKRGQAGHTDHVAGCCCETCDAPGCEADAAARGCASPFLTAACCCEACDTAGATPGCEADAAARAKAGCAPASFTATRGKAVAPAARGKTAGACALSAGRRSAPTRCRTTTSTTTTAGRRPA
jgi:hypothetical protein